MAPTSYTSSLRLTNQPEGGNANTWGIIADTNFELLDDSITAQTCVNITGGGSYTLTTNNGSDDEARAAAIYVHGTPTSANSLIIPAAPKPYLVRTGFTSITGGITLRTTTGTGVNFLTGQSRIVYCDGLSVYAIAESQDALERGNNLSDLTNVSAAKKNLDLGFIASCSTYSSAFQVSAGKLELIAPQAYPVGSIYMNADVATNPNTLLGYGTWTAFGQGRMLVGIGTGIDAAGTSVDFLVSTCGGKYNVALSADNLPPADVTYPAGAGYFTDGTSFAGTAEHPVMDGPGTPNATPADIEWGQIAGNSSPFSIQNPWITVYMWRRVA